MNDRYQRGLEKMGELNPQAPERMREMLQDIAPDFFRYIVEFPYGEIYSREVLSLKERQIATISALAALGNAKPQLKAHIKSALNIGLTREEIIEIMMQMAVFAGFPAALNGIVTAKEVFSENQSETSTD